MLSKCACSCRRRSLICPPRFAKSMILSLRAFLVSLFHLSKSEISKMSAITGFRQPVRLSMLIPSVVSATKWSISKNRADPVEAHKMISNDTKEPSKRLVALSNWWLKLALSLSWLLLSGVSVRRPIRASTSPGISLAAVQRRACQFLYL